LVPLVTISSFVVVVGVILGLLIASRPRDTAPGVASVPGRADDAGIPHPEPKPNQQPAAPEKLPKEPERPTDQGAALPAPPAAKEGESKAVPEKPPKEPERPADKAVVPPAPPAAKEGEPKAVPPAALAKEIKNSLGMRLVLIPAGKFLMGSPANEPIGFDVERPQHEVEITQPFYMGVYEVTQEEYQKVMLTNPSWFSAGGGGWGIVAGRDTRRFPVESVSWHQAGEFCRRLSELPEEKRAGRLYRLPTEAEWEYACRGGAAFSELFHFGKTLTVNQANTLDSRLNRTARVGSYPPNGFGLYDMHGNVWEWCLDRYQEAYYKNSPRQDPQGPDAGSERVFRGGSCWDPLISARSAQRMGYEPGRTRAVVIGFRVVMRLGVRTP
jgi:formylglycine-generating enzyme required for sulfatase activity